MVILKDTLEPSLELPRKTYLEKLPHDDRENLEMLSRLFKDVLREKGRKGVLLAVGGTLTKPLPRKDIDLLIIFDAKPDDPDAMKEYEKDFEIFQEIVETMTKQEERFVVKKIIRPAIDEEHGVPGLLKHDGSIRIEANRGVSIDIVRNPIHGVSHALKERKNFFVVLAET